MSRTHFRHSSRFSPLPLLALWFFCVMVGGVAHLSCHLDDAASRNSQPAVPHPCLVCQSLAQSARSDISTQVQASLQPVFTSVYFSHRGEPRAAACASARELVLNRGPPQLRSHFI